MELSVVMGHCVLCEVEIAMVEVYMDEVYDLLEPRKKERQKLNVFNNKGEAPRRIQVV